jgi:nucleotide-binding universal stress UspA family protein
MDADPPFEHIVCGIDGSRSAHEAARQAAALIAPGGLLELIAVAGEWGVGLNAAAVLSRPHARRALDDVARELRACGAHVQTRIVSGRPPHEVLLREAGSCDLLVVGRHSRSRFAGVTLGSTAANLAHRAHVPLLIAVAPPDGIGFPDRILVAADGPGHPERAVRMAGQIAGATGAEITLLRLDWSRRAKRRELAEAVADLNGLGAEPVEIVMGGHPRRRIPEFAHQERASLVVVGSRGLNGTRALGSVSERVAHEAPCSVLIARPPESER